MINLRLPNALVLTQGYPCAIFLELRLEKMRILAQSLQLLESAMDQKR
jgi:hypothetical protein